MARERRTHAILAGGECLAGVLSTCSSCRYYVWSAVQRREGCPYLLAVYPPHRLSVENIIRPPLPLSLALLRAVGERFLWQFCLSKKLPVRHRNLIFLHREYTRRTMEKGFVRTDS